MVCRNNVLQNCALFLAQTTIPRPHTKESRFSEWGSEFNPSSGKPALTVPADDELSRPTKSADARTVAERAVPEALAKQQLLAMGAKQNARGGKTIDSSEADLTTEQDRRRRNSNIGGWVSMSKLMLLRILISERFRRSVLGFRKKLPSLSLELE